MARRRNRLGTLLIAGAAAAFAVMVFTMLAHVEPIEVVDSRLVRSGDSTFIQGKVRNAGSDAGPIAIQVRYFDTNGRKLAEDEVKLPRLGAGAEADFSSPARELPSDVRDFTIYVDRGRNPYGN